MDQPMPSEKELNKMRAGFAKTAIEAYAHATGDTTRIYVMQMQCLLTDLMHWADQTSEDFVAALDHARNIYQSEVRDAASE